MTNTKSPCLLGFNLSQATKALRESRGIALFYFYRGTRRGWGVSITPRPHLTPSKDPVPIVQEAEWASGPVWTGAENLAPYGIRSPDRPSRRQSLYRLRYPAHLSVCKYVKCGTGREVGERVDDSNLTFYNIFWLATLPSLLWLSWNLAFQGPQYPYGYCCYFCYQGCDGRWFGGQVNRWITL